MSKPSPETISTSNLESDKPPTNQSGPTSSRAGTWITLTLFALLLIALIKTFVK